MIKTVHISIGSRVSSGSIVSDYGLDDRAIGLRSPAGAKDTTTQSNELGRILKDANVTSMTSIPALASTY
jgi:hypothetical protein